MHRLSGALLAVGLCIPALLAGPQRASAEILIAIDKSRQRMTVVVDGVEQHVWKVSTGLGGGPRSGTYRPERLERKWYSRKYNWSPMPHAIFFHQGYAIHGTYYVSRLGHPASHGCVRLLPGNAATLFELVRRRGIRNARIVVSNEGYAVKPVAAAARAETRGAVPAAPVSVTAPDLAPAFQPQSPGGAGSD